jgi:hypothetical protein
VTFPNSAQYRILCPLRGAYTAGKPGLGVKESCRD